MTPRAAGPRARRWAGARGLDWADFEHRLAHVLAAMPVESYLIISTESGDADGGYYVQFANGGKAGLRAEAVSSSYLASPHALAPEQEVRLGSLGWQWPGGPNDLDKNFNRQWPNPAPYEEVARLAVASLREVYRVESPAALVYRHRSFEDGRTLDASALGIRQERRTVASETSATPGSSPDRPGPSPDELRERVEGALRVWLGTDELVRDKDGDYPIRVGSALMYVRLMEGVPPLVQLFSIVVADVDGDAALLSTLNEVNGRIRFGRVFLVDRRVIASMELTALDLTADQIAFACNELGNLADGLDDWLSGRFGGSTAFETRRELLN